MTMTELPASLLPTLPGPYYTDPAIFAAEQERIFEHDVVLRRPRLATSPRRRVPDRPGGPGERAGDPVPRTARRGRSSTSAGTAGAKLVRRRRRARSSGPSGACTTPGRTTWTASWSRRPTWSRCRTSTGSSTACAGCTCANGWVTSGSAWPPTRRRSKTTCRAPARNGWATWRRSSATASTSLTVGRRIRYDVRANWKLIIENFMECYHCATIHPELVHVLPEFAGGYAAQYFVGHGAEFGPGVRGLHGRRQRRADHRSPASPRRRTGATSRSPSSRRCSSTWCRTT